MYSWGLQRVRHNWATEPACTQPVYNSNSSFFHKHAHKVSSVFQIQFLHNVQEVNTTWVEDSSVSIHPLLPISHSCLAHTYFTIIILTILLIAFLQNNPYLNNSLYCYLFIRRKERQIFIYIFIYTFAIISIVGIQEYWSGVPSPSPVHKSET